MDADISTDNTPFKQTKSQKLTVLFPSPFLHSKHPQQTCSARTTIRRSLVPIPGQVFNWKKIFLAARVWVGLDVFILGGGLMSSV